MVAVQKFMGVVRVSHVSEHIFRFASNIVAKVFRDFHVIPISEILLPPTAYYDWSRMQYRSELILQWLASIKKKLSLDVLLAIADFDAYADELNFVFGEAWPSEGVACVYLARLKPEFYTGVPDEKLLLERLEKEIIHELGHVFGLPHCSNPQCVMRFSNSVFEVDAKSSRFCTRCAEILRAHGVNINPEYILPS